MNTNAPAAGKTHPNILTAIARVNFCLMLALGIFAFLIPGALVVWNLTDKALREPGVPELAWQLHRNLTPRIGKWAPDRVASGVAGHLNLYDVPSTEWPMFTCVFYLMATENLQREWAKTNPPDSPDAPAVYARKTIAEAAALVADPVHHTWVRQHWGTNYLHTQNVFFRSLVIASLTRYERLTGDRKYHDLLTDQAKTLAEALDASPHGVLEDYPEECYPIDVLAAIGWIVDSDGVTGLDHQAFLQRARRGFEGAMANQRGLPPFFVEDYLAGRTDEPSRGTGNSWILIFAPRLWPDNAEKWYNLYEQYFWQTRVLAAGFREFPKDMPGKDWGFDIDAGPIVAGFSPAANAFAVAATRVNGRFDHAWPLAAQMLTASWPTLGGRLFGASLLSSADHAPYLGESAILYFLTEQPASGVTVKTGGSLPGFVYVYVGIYFVLGFLFVAVGLLSLRRWRRRVSTGAVPNLQVQAALWTVMAGTAVVFAICGDTKVAMIVMLLAQLLPRVLPSQPAKAV
jgi:hypothetical protein